VPEPAGGDFYIWSHGYQWEWVVAISLILFMNSLLEKKVKKFKASDVKISGKKKNRPGCSCKQMKKPTRLAYEWEPHDGSH